MTARRFDFSEESSKREQLQRLLNELRSMIDDPQAEEVDIAEREHLLSCAECAAYEDLTESDELVFYGEDGEIRPDTSFMLIDAKGRLCTTEKMSHYLTSYTFICPLCGLYQTAIIREQFEEELSP